VSINIAFPGDSESPATFGGTTHYLWKALKSKRPDSVGLKLQRPNHLKFRRTVWNLRELGCGRGIGGFQYSKKYLDGMWSGMHFDRGDVCINLYQLYSPSFFRESPCRKVFYIDQTLTQLFENYPESSHISQHHRVAAVTEERHQYHNAEHVICMAQWAADSVVLDYGVDRGRVSVVHPGANLVAQDDVRGKASFELGGLQLLNLLFIGKDARRKGLIRLLEAITEMGDPSDRLCVRVIGCQPEAVPRHLRNMRCVKWLGFVDKKTQWSRFEAALMVSDLGVLLSTAEATGISIREFHYFGLGVIGPNVGGAPDMLVQGAGILINPSDGPKEIAQALIRLIDSNLMVTEFKRCASACRSDMLWDRSAEQILAILGENDLEVS
jgi:glycosyltransferase involved in cell wall biosynthesis